MKLTPRGAFLLTIFFYICVSLVASKWIAMALVGVYVAGLSYGLRSFPEAVCLSFLALWPLNLGKNFPVTLVSGSVLNVPTRPWGIDADVVVSVREVLVGIMGLAISLRILRQKPIVWPNDGLGKALLLLPIVFIVSTFFGSMLPWVSFAHALFFIEPLIFFIYMKTNKVDNYKVFIATLIAVVSFESVLVLAQNMKGQSLGLISEYAPGYIPVDTSRDVLSLRLKFGGTFFDANLLADYLIFALFIILPTVFDETAPLRFIGGVAVLAGTLGLTVTQSRSSWVTWTLALLLFFYLVEKVWRTHLSIGGSLKWMYVLCIPILVVLGVTIVLPRVAGTAFTFDLYGSVETRKLLLEEAISAIASHPFFGVGIGMDVYYMFLNGGFGQSVQSVISYFPEPVHNGFIQLLVQTGSMGFLAYGACWIGLGYLLWHFIKIVHGRDRLYLAGLVGAIVAAFLNAQFQPLLPDLSMIIVLIISFSNSRALR